MTDAWIKPYRDALGQEVCIPGNQSYSRNLKVALGFAFDDVPEDRKNVLFVLLH